MSSDSVKRLLVENLLRAINNPNSFPGEELWRLNVAQALSHPKIAVLLRVDHRFSGAFSPWQKEEIFREVFSSVQDQHPEIRTGRKRVVAAGR